MKKTKFVWTLIILLLSGMFIFRYQISDVVTDIIAEYFIPESKINEEYLLRDGYIIHVYGTTTPHCYEFINEENVGSIFEKTKLLNCYIDNMDDFQKQLKEKGVLEVKTDKDKKEKFKHYGFNVETEDSVVNCDVIKSEKEEYYINIYGIKYTNSEKIYVEYYIETARP